MTRCIFNRRKFRMFPTNFYVTRANFLPPFLPPPLVSAFAWWFLHSHGEERVTIGRRSVNHFCNPLRDRQVCSTCTSFITRGQCIFLLLWPTATCGSQLNQRQALGIINNGRNSNEQLFLELLGPPFSAEAQFTAAWLLALMFLFTAGSQFLDSFTLKAEIVECEA